MKKFLKLLVIFSLSISVIFLVIACDKPLPKPRVIDENITKYKVTSINTNLKNTYIGSTSYTNPGMGEINFSVKLELYEENYFRANYIFSSLMGGAIRSSYMGKAEFSEREENIGEISFHFVLQSESKDDSEQAIVTDKYFSFSAKYNYAENKIFQFSPQITSSTKVATISIDVLEFNTQTEIKQGDTAKYVGVATKSINQNTQTLIGILYIYSDNVFIFDYSFISAEKNIKSFYSGAFTKEADISNEFDILTFIVKEENKDDVVLKANLSGDGLKLYNFKPLYGNNNIFDTNVTLNNIIAEV